MATVGSVVRRAWAAPEWRIGLLITLWGVLLLPRIWLHLLFATLAGDPTDFMIFAQASELIWSGENPYAVESCASCAFRYSPLFAYLFGPFVLLGPAVWALLHVAALLLLPLRLAKVVPFLWPFWWEVGVGSNITFILAAAYWALRGHRLGISGVLLTALLIPRPLLLPLVAWLLVKHREVRVPFAFMGIATVALAIATGYADEWWEVLRSSSSELSVPWNVGPSAFIGGFWVLVGVPLAVLLTLAGRLGSASLAISPYWIPYYLLMGLLDVQKASDHEKGPPEPATWRVLLQFFVTEWFRGRSRVSLRPRKSEPPYPP